MDAFSQYIVMNPDVRFGKPTIRNTRIGVQDVLLWLSEGESPQDIIADFPQLSNESILACLAFAAAGEKRLVYV